MDNSEIVKKLQELEERISKMEKQRYVDMHNVSVMLSQKADVRPEH